MRHSEQSSTNPGTSTQASFAAHRHHDGRPCRYWTGSGSQSCCRRRNQKSLRAGNYRRRPIARSHGTHSRSAMRLRHHSHWRIVSRSALRTSHLSSRQYQRLLSNPASNRARLEKLRPVTSKLRWSCVRPAASMRLRRRRSISAHCFLAVIVFLVTQSFLPI